MLQCLSSTRPLRDFCLRRDFRQEVPGGGRAQELTEGRATTPAPPFKSSFPQKKDFVGSSASSSDPEPESWQLYLFFPVSDFLEVVFHPLGLLSLPSCSH